MLIPKRQVIHQSRKQTCLKHSKQESDSRHTSKAIRSAHTHGNGAPAKHQKRQPPARTQLLEQDVAGDLEDGIRDEKDHESDVELLIAHVGGVLQVIVGRDIEDLCIADVGAVEEAEEVDARGDRDDAGVLLPEKFLFCLCDGALLGWWEFLGESVLVDLYLSCRMVGRWRDGVFSHL